MLAAAAADADAGERVRGSNLLRRVCPADLACSMPKTTKLSISRGSKITKISKYLLRQQPNMENMKQKTANCNVMKFTLHRERYNEWNIIGE